MRRKELNKYNTVNLRNGIRGKVSKLNKRNLIVVDRYGDMYKTYYNQVISMEVRN